MEGKYFKGQNILEAQLGSRPSFAWKSILGSCNLLKEGLIWRKGNGLKVRIWKDKWLPRNLTYLVQSTPTMLDLGATVDELIDGDTKWWRLDLLETLFTKKEVTLIQSIPVSTTNREDVCIWRGTKSGYFSVKCAYHLQMELESKGQAKTLTRQNTLSV
jgi:hypothetical protein